MRLRPPALRPLSGVRGRRAAYLTDLSTSGENPPTTRVRLRKDFTIIAVDQGESARALLREALASGTLSGSASAATPSDLRRAGSPTCCCADRLSKHPAPSCACTSRPLKREAGIEPAGRFCPVGTVTAMSDGIADVSTSSLP